MVELKVATGGQGRYYRRSLIQATLYAHFIRHVTGLDPWFRAAGLDRTATQPCIGVPIPTRWTKRFINDLELLKRVAARVGVEVHVLDDRAAPDWTIAGGSLPEFNEVEGERRVVAGRDRGESSARCRHGAEACRSGLAMHRGLGTRQHL